MQAPTKHWHYQALPPPEQVEALASQLNISRIPATLLLQRQVHDYATAKGFFRPDLDQLHDPFLMHGMAAAVRRIREAMERQERVLIYGDYDVDGVTSVALVYGLLREQYPHVRHFIPSRHTEGYGFSVLGAKAALEQSPDLIITLDCGINDVAGVAYARAHGVDTIICDHHLPDAAVAPAAVAILNPQQPECGYPFKGLSGCGVGFKLMQGLLRDQGKSELPLFGKLDLVAVSICADIVPMTGENRVLVHYGLQKLDKSPSAGLQALRGVVARASQRMSVSNIVFRIAPRLNVAGRLGSAKEALDLLLCPDRKLAHTLAQSLEEKNILRRQLEQKAFKEACQQVEAQPKSRSVIVVYGQDWNIGILGIVAARCAERYHLPAVVMGRVADFLVGSGRSAGGFDLHGALQGCQDLLLSFGGHQQAVGIKMQPQQLDAFRERLDDQVRQCRTPAQAQPSLIVDMEIELPQLTLQSYRIIQQMAPFGPGNMRPVFSARGVRVSGPIKKVKESHLAFQLRQGEQAWSAIAFQMIDRFAVFNSRHLLDVVFVVREVHFHDRQYLELEIRDVSLHQPHP